MIAGAGAAARVLHRASDLRQTSARRIADYLAVRHGVTAFLSLGIADILFPLSGRLRGLLLLWSLATVLLRRRESQKTPAPDFAAVARLVETGKPELDNALIHAVQFSALIDAAPESPAVPLMRRELERAERDAAALSATEMISLAPLRRERRRAQIALALTLLSMLILPRAWWFEIPRLLAFWQDRPPFTLTDFAVVPGSRQIPAGGGLTVTARLSGPLPDALELVSAQDGEAAQSAPMLKLDAQTFSARMENLTADTWYYVRGETGRSPRYHLMIAPAQAKKANTDNLNNNEKSAVQAGDNAQAVAENNAKQELRDLADTQAKLAADAKQNAQRNPKPNDPQTAKLRQRQREIAQKANALSQKLKDAPEYARAKSKLMQARQAMNRVATGSVSKNSAAAAEKLKQAAQENGGAGNGQAAGTRRDGKARPTDERALPQFRDRSGQMPYAPPSAGLPLTGKNGGDARYPPEYRKLVQDYFQSVAGKK